MGYCAGKLMKNCSYLQGSRLTFQLASPVASDRFDPLAKKNFSLARRRHLLLWKSMMFIAADVLNSAHFDSISFCEQFEINF